MSGEGLIDKIHLFEQRNQPNLRKLKWRSLHGLIVIVTIYTGLSLSNILAFSQSIPPEILKWGSLVLIIFSILFVLYALYEHVRYDLE